MGSLVVVIAWVLIRHLLADKNVRASVTSLNLTPPATDLERPNSSSAQTATTEAIPDESLDSFVKPTTGIDRSQTTSQRSSGVS